MTNDFDLILLKRPQKTAGVLGVGIQDFSVQRLDDIKIIGTAIRATEITVFFMGGTGSNVRTALDALTVVMMVIGTAARTLHSGFPPIFKVYGYYTILKIFCQVASQKSALIRLHNFVAQLH